MLKPQIGRANCILLHNSTLIYVTNPLLLHTIVLSGFCFILLLQIELNIFTNKILHVLTISLDKILRSKCQIMGYANFLKFFRHFHNFSFIKIRPLYMSPAIYFMSIQVHSYNLQLLYFLNYELTDKARPIFKIFIILLLIFKEQRGLLWWFSGQESACQCRRNGFNPWFRKIPHAAKQIGPYAATIEPAPQSQEGTVTEPTCPRAHAPQQEKPSHQEAHTRQLENKPRLPRLENSNEDPAWPKINTFLLKSLPTLKK